MSFKFSEKVLADILAGAVATPALAYDEIRVEQKLTRIVVSFMRGGEMVATMEESMPYFASGDSLVIAGLDGRIVPTVSAS